MRDVVNEKRMQEGKERNEAKQCSWIRMVRLRCYRDWT